MVVSAELISTNSLFCAAPEFVEMRVEFRLQNLVTLDVSSAAVFEYVSDMQVGTVAPISGSVAGATLISIFGQKFPDVAIFCKMGNSEQLPAKRVSSSEVRCLAPRVSHPQEVDVAVSFNGIDYL